MAGAAIEFARRVYHAGKRFMGTEQPQVPDPNPFPIDAWCQDAYPAWFEAHKATVEELDLQRESYKDFSYQPAFSFIIPLYKTPSEYLHTAVDSVLAQTYPNFQLVLVNASPEMENLASEVEAYAKQDNRITAVTLKSNLGITENTNAGLEVAAGEFCCFMDHDDFIEPNLLYEYVAALNANREIDVLYCDEDLVEHDDSTGSFKHLHVLFKPVLTPELLLCKNAIVHLMTIRRSLIDQMERPNNHYDGAQDYNMILFATNKARKVHGVQRVLYHWRTSETSTAANPQAKPYSRRAYRLSAANELARRVPGGKIVASGIINIHNIWLPAPSAKVSVIVDAADENKAASFEEFFNQANTYSNYELLYTYAYSSASNVYERFNSTAASATGDYLLFLDSGCMLLTPESLEQLVSLCSLEGLGVSSPKLLYADGNNKTYGVAVTSERIMPMYRGYEDSFPGYQCNLRAFQNVSATALQGLCTSRALFERLGGFDAQFTSEVGASEYGIRVREAGYRLVVTPTVKIEVSETSPEHYFVCTENAPDYADVDIVKFDVKHPGLRANGDPYLSANLNQSSNYCQI